MSILACFVFFFVFSKPERRKVYWLQGQVILNNFGAWGKKK